MEATPEGYQVLAALEVDLEARFAETTMHERGVFVASIHWSVKLQGYGPHAKATQGAELVYGLPNFADFVMEETGEAIWSTKA